MANLRTGAHLYREPIKRVRQSHKPLVLHNMCCDMKLAEVLRHERVHRVPETIECEYKVNRHRRVSKTRVLDLSVLANISIVLP